MIYFALFQFKRINVKSIASLIITIPLAIYIFSLDFMGEKIQDRAHFEGLTNERMHDINYNEQMYGDEYIGSLDRFESAYFEWINFQQEPLLGYGRNTDHSWFCQEISENLSLTGGLVKIFSQYGIVIGMFLYALLFYSSYRISLTFNHQQKGHFCCGTHRILHLISCFQHPRIHRILALRTFLLETH